MGSRRGGRAGGRAKKKEDGRSGLKLARPAPPRVAQLKKFNHNIVLCFRAEAFRSADISSSSRRGRRGHRSRPNANERRRREHRNRTGRAAHVVGVFFVRELHEPVSLVRVRHPVLRDVHVHDRAGLDEHLPQNLLRALSTRRRG
eukprot:29123-Pelagococcus_subviridis.AAC.3